MNTNMNNGAMPKTDKIWEARKRNKGRGWEEVRIGRDLFDYAFKCRDCGAQIEGFVVSPRFCPHCGKEHG